MPRNIIINRTHVAFFINHVVMASVLYIYSVQPRSSLSNALDHTTWGSPAKHTSSTTRPLQRASLCARSHVMLITNAAQSRCCCAYSKNNYCGRAFQLYSLLVVWCVSIMLTTIWEASAIMYVCVCVFVCTCVYLAYASRGLTEIYSKPARPGQPPNDDLAHIWSATKSNKHN